MKKLMILALALTVFCSYSDIKCTKKHNKKQRLEQKKQYKYQKKQQSKKLKKQKQRQQKRTIKEVFSQVRKFLSYFDHIDFDHIDLKKILSTICSSISRSSPPSSKSHLTPDTSFEPFENAEELAQAAADYTHNLKNTFLYVVGPTIKLALHEGSLKKNICVPLYDQIEQAVNLEWLEFANQEMKRLRIATDLSTRMIEICKSRNA